MGHSSARAAQVYLHARRERDQEIASSLGKIAAGELKKTSSARSAASPRNRARSGHRG
ncbi:hypothetical protein [Actinomadura macra]|uniref:hypothetical protein n=1 Tax=Actinomadura macra TaxID=46164 RepID=UPI000A534127|nr:hypothetical protein [Actinomadura macra]